MPPMGKWYLEALTPHLVMGISLVSTIYSGKTPYQRVEVMETVPFGRSLVLDGKTQSTLVDEHLYHETLVHPAMLHHPNPQTVFIGGGGEGATLREVLSHPTVRKAVMVDIDREVVELCQRYLPELNRGSFQDPRASVHFDDARKFLASYPDKFDVIIMDLADPLEGGPAYRLYTQEFYRMALGKLNPGGVLVTQSGPAGPFNHAEGFTVIVRTLGSVFPRVYPYSQFVPAFATPWGFSLATTRETPWDPSPEELDHLIQQRLGRTLRFYDGLTHRAMFSLPTYLRRGLEQEHRLATDDNPIFIP